MPKRKKKRKRTFSESTNHQSTDRHSENGEVKKRPIPPPKKRLATLASIIVVMLCWIGFLLAMAVFY